MEKKDYNQYPRRWQYRFDFFDAFGAPGTSTYNEGLAQRGREKKSKILINFNFYAFFFGIFYFLILGLWKKAFVLFAMTFALISVLEVLETATGIRVPDSAINVVMGMVAGWLANYNYYLKEVKGSKSWNIFEGMKK